MLMCKKFTGRTVVYWLTFVSAAILSAPNGESMQE